MPRAVVSRCVAFGFAVFFPVCGVAGVAVALPAPPGSGCGQYALPQRAAEGRIDALLVDHDGGVGVADTPVTLTGVDVCGDPVRRRVVTGPDGTASFRGLLSGRYRMTACKAGPDDSAAVAAAVTDLDLAQAESASVTVHRTACT